MIGLFLNHQPQISAGAPGALHYRPDIDGLRAVAVAAVVLHHAFPNAVKGGFIGVDIFFVISGFLISQLLLRDLQAGKFSLGVFYQRRIRRLFPALALVMSCTLVAGWYLMVPQDFKRLGLHTLAGSTFTANFAFLQEAGYFDAESHRKPLLHLWSLAIEEQFYIVWPLLLYALHRWRLSAGRWIAVLLTLSLLYSIWLLGASREAAFFNPASRFWELMVGAILAALFANNRLQGTPRGGLIARVFSKHTTAFAGLGLLVLVLAQLTPERRFPGGWALAGTIAALLLIAAGPSSWVNRVLLSNRPMVWLGTISYPLYLWHWPLLSFAHIRHGGRPERLEQIAWVALSILLAWLTYLWVERPIRFGRFQRTKAVYAVLIAAMVALGAAGYAVYRTDGGAGRYPSLVRDMLTRGGEKDVTEGWRLHECMLGFDQTTFLPSCTDQKRPLLFLWGDSHAGSIYPGFKALQDAGRYSFGLAQRTAAICPPILGIEPRENCRETNDRIMEEVRQLKPEIVVLYAFWHEKALFNRYDMTNFESTVRAIQQAGVKKVVVLGAAPFWKAYLPELLINEWKKGPPENPPPLRLPRSNLDPFVQDNTLEMKRRSEALGVTFISGLDTFCDTHGCLTRLGERDAKPLSYDYGHLTVAGSTYWVDQIADQLFEGVR